MAIDTQTTTTATSAAPVTNASGGSLVDKVKGKAEEAIGTVIGDEHLVAAGKLHGAKAAAADDAAELAETASLKQAQADLTAREKAATAEAATLAAETAKETAQQTIVAEQAGRDAEAERAAATAKQNAETTKRARVASADKQEFDAARGYRAEVADADAIEAKARRVRASATLPKVETPVTGVGGQLRAIPGKALSTYLSVLRLPVSAYERRAGSTTSAVSLAFERVDATLRQLLGSVTKDPSLLAEARRQNIELGRLGEAADLDAAAKAKRAQASNRLTAAKKASGAAKRNAETAATDQVKQADARKQNTKDASKSQASKASAAAETTAKTRKSAVAASQRAGQTAQLRKEQEALAAERALLSRENDVIRLDDAADLEKAARVSS